MAKHIKKVIDEAGGADKIGHNSAERVSGDELKKFMLRYEKLDSDKKSVGEAMQDVIRDLREKGYDAKTFRDTYKIWRKDKDKAAEDQALLETYCGVLGLPLFQRVAGQAA